MLLLVFAGASLASFLGFVVSQLLLNIPLLTHPEMLNNLTNPQLVPALRVMQVLQSIGMLIVPSVIFLWLSSSWAETKVLFLSPKRQPLIVGIAVFLVALPFINFVADWNAQIELPSAIGTWMKSKEGQADMLTIRFLDMPNIWLLVFNLFMIGLLPALGEELIFRGVIQRGIMKRFGNPHLAIWLAAVLFSAVHFQFLGFVPRMLMGVALGYLFYWSGNLWYPIVAHFTNNATAVILTYGIQHNSLDPGLDTAGTGNAAMATFSLAFCMMLLYLFKKHQEAERQTV